MATLTPVARRIGSAVVSALGLVRAPFSARGDRRRRQEELTVELLARLGCIAEGIEHMVEEIHRANLIRQHRLVTEQLDRAIDDPSLAAALSTLNGISDLKRRQLMFANREYGTILLAHRIGYVDWNELVGHLRMLSRNEVFAEYWERTVEHRRSLPEESLEARVGRAVDTIMEELAEDPDEWWVVGPAPEEVDPAPGHAPGRPAAMPGHAPGHAPEPPGESRS
ncbi:DUF6082 family protein [Streptomyces sp. NPDC046862]|uniref:DUF6082 family protein n=1 Tax=Streptomyces sp. NPDC046862 TaxID=3154603 RepID=UPI0034534BD7